MGKKQHITFQSGNHAFNFKLFSYAWVELHHSSDKCTWPHVQTSKFNTHNLHINPYEFDLERVAWKNGKIIFAAYKAQYFNFWAISHAIWMGNCVLKLKTKANKLFPTVIRHEILQVCTGQARQWWEPLDIRGNLVEHVVTKFNYRMYCNPGKRKRATYLIDQANWSKKISRRFFYCCVANP